MIEARQLHKAFGTFTAVERLSFQVLAGESLMLIGPSGCGKTTTLKMLNGLIAPTSGEIWIEGQPLHGQDMVQLRRRMGYVIQDIGLFPHYSVAENIGVVPRLLGWPSGKIKKRCATLLEQLGLPPGAFAKKKPHELSGGQQQRVGIARALAADPPIILMDEPFGALDPLTRQQIRRDFQQLEALRQKTVVMVTHDIEEAFEMGTHIAVLNQGQIADLSPPGQLLKGPVSDFTAAFLEEKAPQLEFRSLKLGLFLSELPQSLPGVKPEDCLQAQPSAPLLRSLHRLSKSGRPALCFTANEKRYFATADSLLRLFQNHLRP